MFRTACFALTLFCLTAQGAVAECWTGDSVRAFQFLWNASASDVEDCLRKGVDPNERADDGFPELYTMASIGLKNKDALSIIHSLLRAGGDPHSPPRKFKSFVTAIYRAEENWGKDSDVARAMRGEALPRRKAAPSPSGADGWERTAVVYGWTGENYTGRLAIFVTRGQHGDHAAALARAMANCRAAGRWACSEQGSYVGRCFSIAHGDDNFTGGGTEINEVGFGTGDTLAEADQAALTHCRLARNVGCKIWGTNMRKCSD